MTFSERHLKEEQMIIFVYDTEFCQTEADDPQKAVLFFHPHWVSDQQRLALCGQLMGAAHFCSTLFSSPRILTLQCGKFVIKKFGKYILSVGSDQTLQEWILQERFNTLELLVQFYHNSFSTIFAKAGSDQETFSKKLTEILEIYIPVLHFVVCSVGNVFVVRCPKKTSAAFLEAFQLLEACCSFQGVLGGVVLHNSRVLATQLEPDISKLLALTDRFHIRTHAEQIKTPFHLPVGVQLLKVYLKQKVYEALCNAANLKSSTFNGAQKKYFQKATKKKKEPNKIFTVQEEDDLNFFLSKPVDLSNGEVLRCMSRKMKPKVENSSYLKERSKSFVGNINIKVCPTPTVEKTLIHEELVSICSSKGKSEQKSLQPGNLVPDLLQVAIRAKTRPKYNRLHRMSMDDLMIDFTHKSYPLPLKYYSLEQAMVCREIEPSKVGKKSKKRLYKTITDPVNPVFRHDGILVSKSLYNNCLSDHYKDFVAANLTIDSREAFLKSKYLENESFKKKSIESDVEEKQTDSKVNDKENTVKDKPKEAARMEVKELTNLNQKAFRRSLSLPLKPLFQCDTAGNSSQNCVSKNKVLLSRTPTTPLMTKLSLLGFEEKTDKKLIAMTTEHSQLKPLVKNAVTTDIIGYKQKAETISSCLFVCAHQNMTILLVLDEDVEKNPDLILSLWEISSAALKKVENLRNKTLAHLSASGRNSSSYSFLSVDSHWGTVQRCGPWGDDELKIVGSLQNDLINSPKITEIIIRNEDSVLYGYSSGGSKIFYQQGGCSSAGLPTPADLMGVVTLKARRRLERDKDVVLL